MARHAFLNLMFKGPASCRRQERPMQKPCTGPAGRALTIQGGARAFLWVRLLQDKLRPNLHQFPVILILTVVGLDIALHSKLLCLQAGQPTTSKKISLYTRRKISGLGDLLLEMCLCVGWHNCPHQRWTILHEASGWLPKVS